MTNPIASGRTADIFEWSPGVVLKLYKIDISRRTVEHEMNAQGYAAEQGVSTPSTYEFVEQDGRLGFTMDRVDGPNGMDILFGGADIVEQADMLADLQRATLRFSGGDLPSLKKRQEDRILRTPELDNDQKSRLCSLLSQLPDGDRLLHGDFHPANVIHSDRGPVIIDWIDCSKGPVEADIARSLILFGYCGCNQPSDMRSHYTERYLEQMGGIDQPHLKGWLLVQAAARICEGTEDTAQIIEFVRNSLATIA